MVGVLAAAARAFGKARLLAVILAVGGAVAAPILARVAVDTAKDPTSHNLWPFEFIIAAVLGALCSSAGALVGSLPALEPTTGMVRRKIETFSFFGSGNETNQINQTNQIDPL